jgi:DNA repair photolyase
MHTLLGEVASILTPQRKGFLASGPHPFTHALSAYLGCGYGMTTCGMYCYAQYLPNWQFRGFPANWGEAVQVKSNAPDLLLRALSSMKPEARRVARVFMSSTTDPYQPIERRHEVTRRCLDAFSRFPDLDLLVVQTRSPLAGRDLPLLRQIPYAWLSVTIETDNQQYLTSLNGGPPLERRWALVRAASDAGVPVQITVSPCLAYTEVERFGARLLASGACRIVVDTPVDGDGSAGKRTGRSRFARAESRWRDTGHARRLFDWLGEHADSQRLALGWSTAGFCGIPPRQLAATTPSFPAHP